MNRYKITYNGKTVIRRGENAEDAIDRLCDQYGWRSKLNQYDADTRGQEWAECSVDTDGGINWAMTILAEKED